MISSSWPPSLITHIIVEKCGGISLLGDKYGFNVTTNFYHEVVANRLMKLGVFKGLLVYRRESLEVANWTSFWKNS